VTEDIRIADVIIGERARKDYGDLGSLMESIREVGLLQPIGLSLGNQLLVGGRRLEACRRLGWESIPFTQTPTREDAVSLLVAERDENTCRKDMTPEELVDLGLRLEELERPKAKERQGERTDLTSRASAREVEFDPKNPTTSVVGPALGLSTDMYKRAKYVVQVARGQVDSHPKTRTVAQEVVEQMNAGEASVRAAYDKVRKAREQTEAPKKQAPKANLAVPQPARYGRRRKHLQVLEAITTTLAGLTIATEEITELDNSVTAEEAAQFLRDLSPQIRSLNRIRNLIQERTQ